MAVPAPPQPRPPADDVEREVARTAELVLRLTALAERYEAGAGSAERLAILKEAVARGRRQLAALAAVDGVDVAGLEPATSRV